MPMAGVGKRSLAQLVEITYPWGTRSIYDCEKVDGNMNSDSSALCQYYRVTSRRVVYAEGQTPSNYPIEDYIYSDTNYTAELDVAHTPVQFTISCVRKDGTITEHRFTKGYRSKTERYYIVKTSEITYYLEDDEQVLLREITYGDYYNDTYPTKIVTKEYNAAGEASTKIENFTYNQYRDLLQYWDWRAQGDTASTEHLTRYTYDSHYHIQTMKSYQQDAATAIMELHILTADYKNVAETQIWVNDRLFSKQMYSSMPPILPAQPKSKQRHMPTAM